MRTSLILGATLGLLTAALTFSGTARAEQEFDVSVVGDQVVVTPKGEWHINRDFPWKLVMGEAKLDKTKFSLSESKATVSAPKGKAHLRGAVCIGGKEPQCKPFEKDIEIK